MKNSHKFWLIILIPLIIIYLSFNSIIVFITLVVFEFVFSVVFLVIFFYNDLIWYVKNDKFVKFLAFLNPICWVLLLIAYFNKWIDNELY